MGLRLFEILLDNPHQSYFAGQIVAGRVLIESDRKKKIKGVKLKLQGKAKTHWKESRGKSSTTVSETENYIDEKVYLFGYEESEPEVWLTEGRTEYPFYFKLPNDIPSSFEMKHGYVKYYLEAVVSRCLKFDHKVRTLFTVNGLLDLNTEWAAGHPGELAKQKLLCCFCCTTGPVGFRLKVPRTGYVPGETIPFFMELFNSSPRALPPVSLALIQYATFHAKKKTRHETNQVTLVKGPPVEPGGNEVWEGNILEIPSVPPTRLGGCRIIEVDYFVKIEVEIPGSVSLKGKVPVIVGTIPLRNTFEDLMPPSSSLLVPDTESLTSYNPGMSSALLPSMTDYPNLPPPTYEEAVFSFHSVSKSQFGDEEDEGSSKPSSPDSAGPPPPYGNVAETGSRLLTTTDSENGSRAPTPHVHQHRTHDNSDSFVPKYVTYRQNPGSGPAGLVITQPSSPSLKSLAAKSNLSF